MIICIGNIWPLDVSVDKKMAALQELFEYFFHYVILNETYYSVYYNHSCFLSNNHI